MKVAPGLAVLPVTGTVPARMERSGPVLTVMGPYTSLLVSLLSDTLLPASTEKRMKPLPNLAVLGRVRDGLENSLVSPAVNWWVTELLPSWVQAEDDLVVQ